METLISYKDTPLYLALKAADVSEELAVAAAQSFLDFSNNLATKKDISKLREETQKDISGIRGDISGIREDISKLETKIADIKVDNQKMILSLFKWALATIIGTVFVVTGILVSVMLIIK